ncbi:MAG: nucleotide exchange factor GrpE [Chthoniobacterales bacterium]
MKELSVVEADFAAVMQELSAQAAAAGPSKAETDAGLAILISAVHSLGQRVESLEESVVRKFESIHFKKIEDQLDAIRETESVNQSLFDSLHSELISYRDNFVRESLQKPFIRDLLVLFDDLSAIAGQFELSSTKKAEDAENVHSRNNLDNALHFLVEILHRLEVKEIELYETVDRNFHRVMRFEPAENAEEDGRIVQRLKRGFTWHGRVLRHEEVAAKRFD